MFCDHDHHCATRLSPEEVIATKLRSLIRRSHVYVFYVFCVFYVFYAFYAFSAFYVWWFIQQEEVASTQHPEEA
jgi:hypothetical protein